MRVGEGQALRSRLSRPVRGWASAELLEKVAAEIFPRAHDVVLSSSGLYWPAARRLAALGCVWAASVLRLGCV